MFSVWDFVEAVDECGHWASAEILQVATLTFLVAFSGWNTRFNRWVGDEEVRPPTVATETSSGE